jgi:acetate---CoA ligase (ADP-forming)
MINDYLIDPRSIVVVGGSNDCSKPGGKVVMNLLNGRYSGKVYIVNPGKKEVQGIKSFSTVNDVPNAELAIIAVSARKCFSVIEALIRVCRTRSFIVLSAGFKETGKDGAILEKDIVDLVNGVNGCLIGPNCIGMLNVNYSGVFTTPVPDYHRSGCDMVSSSGATAVFIMEAGMLNGLKFANIYSVGNAAQTSVEDILAYMDETYDDQNSPKIKLLYLETIENPGKLLRHATSLINKGAKIAAIKAGVTNAGCRAAESHTGAITNSDVFDRALFEKAGIVYCSGREEIVSVGSIFNYKKLKGKNIAIITHAGGSAVMLADTLSAGGLNIPRIEGEHADQLLKYLNEGASVSNPIDFLATGTAEQLGIIIDYCEHKFNDIDAMIVVFGSPGLFDVEHVYNVLSVKLDVCSKPIYPVLPSLLNARREIDGFLAGGNVNFPDEVVLGKALAEVYYSTNSTISESEPLSINSNKIRSIINRCKDGFLPPQYVGELLDAANITRTQEAVVTSKNEMRQELRRFNYPVVMKVVGPIHKSEVGGVVVGVNSLDKAVDVFDNFMNISGSSGVLIQAMCSGVELFIGAKKREGYSNVVLCGLGGIFVEVLKDISACLTPVTKGEAIKMIKSLKGYPLLEGIRGNEGIDQVALSEIICKVSHLVEVAPEIAELDINPLLGSLTKIVAVDARIRLDKQVTT